MTKPSSQIAIRLAALAAFVVLLMPAPAPAATVDLSATGANASSPQVVVGPDGSATVVWARNDGANDRIQAVRINSAGTIGAVDTLSAAGASASGQRVAVDSDGIATIVWSRNGVVQLARYGASGQVGSVLDVSTQASASAPEVAVGGDNVATVVWGFIAFPTITVQGRRVAADGTMGAVAGFGQLGSSQTTGRVAAGPNGIATVVWLDTGAVYAQGLGPSGKIGTNPVTVFPVQAPPLQGATAVQVAAGPDNGVTVAWSADGGVRAERLGGVEALLSSESADQPQVAVGPDSVASVAWRRNDGTNTRVRAIRFNGAGAVGTGTDFSAAGQNANTADVAVGPTNAATAVWRRTNGTNFIVQTADRSTAGVVGPVTDLSAVGQNGNNPQVSVGASGRTVATWARSNGTHTIIQAVILSSAPSLTASSGTTPYTEDAAPVVVDSGITVTPGNFANLTSARVSIQSGFETGDTLGFSNQNGISGSYDPATGVLSLTGSSSVANYQTALQSITFRSTHQNPATSKTVDFKVNDGTDSNVVTKGLQITRENDNPVANNDTATVAEDSLASAASNQFAVLSNDTDAEGDAIDITAVSGPANGTAAIVAGTPEKVSYQPDANYCNEPGAALDDTITYTVNGGDTATVSVSVTCADDDPVANNDTATVAEDSLASAASNQFAVLSNDTDVDSDSIDITAVSDPANGTAAIVAGTPEKVSYQPDANYCNEPGRRARRHDHLHRQRRRHGNGLGERDVRRRRPGRQQRHGDGRRGLAGERGLEPVRRALERHGRGFGLDRHHGGVGSRQRDRGDRRRHAGEGLLPARRQLLQQRRQRPGRHDHLHRQRRGHGDRVGDRDVPKRRPGDRQRRDARIHREPNGTAGQRDAHGERP